MGLAAGDDPPEKVGGDAEICWWVLDAEVGGELEAAVRVAVPEWIAAAWPFTAPRFVGEAITWDELLALADLDRA